MNLHDQAVWHNIELSGPELFNWMELLAYFNRSQNECLHRVVDGQVWKCIEVDGEPVLVRVGSQTAGSLQVSYKSCRPADDAVTRYVREWLDMERNLEPFYDLAERDPMLSPLVREYRGLRIVGVHDLFEALCWAVLGQQVNLAFAYTLKRRIVETFGTSVLADGETYWMFPKPESLLPASVDDLRGLQLTGRKSEYVLGIAQLMAEGILSKEGLLAMGGGPAAEKELCSIRGVGPWSANYVLMRCLRWADAFPIQDAGLHQAVQKSLGTNQKPSVAELESMSRSWAGWRAYAVFYLWRSLLP